MMFSFFILFPTEEPDEDEDDENSEESVEDESEEDLTGTPKTSSTQPPYSLIPPPPVWVQRNQGLSMRTRFLNHFHGIERNVLNALRTVARCDQTHLNCYRYTTEISVVGCCPAKSMAFFLQCGAG